MNKVDMEFLRRNGFVNVENPRDLQELNTQALKLLRLFVQEPDQTKRRLSKPDPNDPHRDFGFMVREDGRQLVEITETNLDELRHLAQDIPSAHALMEGFVDMLAVATLSVYEFLGTFEQYSGIPGVRQEVLGNKPNWTWRLIHYPQGMPVLIAPHVDRGGFTFHMAETRPGGRYLTLDQNPANRKWVPFPIGGGQTIIFVSLQIQYLTDGEFTGLCHDVVPDGGVSTDSREAIVLFIDRPKKDRSGSFDGIQKGMMPGQTYGMGRKELDKYSKRQLRELVPA